MAQVGIAAGALLMVSLWPPARGTMLVVPLAPVSQGRLADIAIGHGGRLFGTGPLPGSLLIQGDRAALAPAYRRLGAILVAAASPACDALVESRA